MSRRPSTLDDLIERVGSATILEALTADPLPDEPFDWSAVMDEDRAFVAEVLVLADRCCDEMLDVEFRTIARRILARCARGEPRALRRSANRARFAAGLVWLAGKANGEFALRSRWNADSLWLWFGVNSCSERGISIRKAACLIPEPRTWEPLYDRDPTIKLGDPSLLHSRTRAQLMQRRDTARGVEARPLGAHAWSMLADGKTAEVRARPARAVAVLKGNIANTGRVQMMIGLGESLPGASFFALSIPDAYDLLDRLEHALDLPA